MKKAILCFFILGSITSFSFSQQVIKAGPLPVITNDTIFLGFANVVKLHNDSLLIIKASSENRQVEVKENRLILKPTALGKITVDITYQNKTEQKTFYSKILPDPRN